MRKSTTAESLRRPRHRSGLGVGDELWWSGLKAANRGGQQDYRATSHPPSSTGWVTLMWMALYGSMLVMVMRRLPWWPWAQPHSAVVAVCYLNRSAHCWNTNTATTAASTTAPAAYTSARCTRLVTYSVRLHHTLGSYSDDGSESGQYTDSIQ